MSFSEREIVIPHTDSGPMTAMKNVVLQASLTQLQDNGYYERYVKVVDPEVLAELSTSLGLSWISADVADAHYAACDALNLSAEEITAMGSRVGGRVQETALVSAARAAPNASFDLWSEAVWPLHRVWARVYQGGSVQVVKIGPKTQQSEFRGFTLVRYRYYRVATLAAMSAAHAAMGAMIESAKIMSYDVKDGSLAVRMTWA